MLINIVLLIINNIVLLIIINIVCLFYDNEFCCQILDILTTCLQGPGISNATLFFRSCKSRDRHFGRGLSNKVGRYIKK